MNYDDAFKEVMGRRIDGSTLTNLDVYLVGEQVLNMVNVCLTLGHASPANSLDYVPDPVETDHVSKHIVFDLLAWVSGRKHLAPDCDQRLLGFVADEWQSGKLAALHASLTDKDAA